MAGNPSPDELNRMIAGNLKELRRARGLTLDEAAELTHVSKSMLGQIERGECGLSVATLWKIANGLKISFTALMREERPEAEIVDNRAATPLTNGQSGFRLYPVFPAEPDRDFEILYIELEPGICSCSEPHEKGTEEFVLVYEGTLTLMLGETRYAIPAGHSIRYRGDLRHSYANEAAQTARLCMVLRYRAAQ